MCVTDQSESGHYYAEGRFTPAMTTPVSILVRGVYQVKNNNYSRRRLYHGTAMPDAPNLARGNGFSTVIVIKPS